MVRVRLQKNIQMFKIEYIEYSTVYILYITDYFR